MAQQCGPEPRRRSRPMVAVSRRQAPTALDVNAWAANYVREILALEHLLDPASALPEAS